MDNSINEELIDDKTKEQLIIKYFGAFISNSIYCENHKFYSNYNMFPKKVNKSFVSRLETYLKETYIDFSSEKDILQKASDFYNSDKTIIKFVKNICIGEQYTIIKGLLVTNEEFENAINYINSSFTKPILEIINSNIVFKSNIQKKLNKFKNVPLMLDVIQGVLTANDDENKKKAINKLSTIISSFRALINPIVTKKMIKEFEALCQQEINKINNDLDLIFKEIPDKDLAKKVFNFIYKSKFVYNSEYKLGNIQVEYDRLYMDLNHLRMELLEDKKFNVKGDIKENIKLFKDLLPYKQQIIECIEITKDIDFIKGLSEYKKIKRGVDEKFFEPELKNFMLQQQISIKIDFNTSTISNSYLKDLEFDNKNFLDIFKSIYSQGVLNELNNYVDKIKSVILKENDILKLIPDKMDRVIIDLVYNVPNKGITTYVDALKGIKNKSLKDYNIQSYTAWGYFEDCTKEKIKSKIADLIDEGLLTITEKRASFGRYNAIVVSDKVKKLFKQFKNLRSILVKRNNGEPLQLKTKSAFKLEEILTDISKNYIVDKAIEIKNNLTLNKLVKIIEILENEVFFNEQLWRSISVKIDKFKPEFFTYLEFELNSTDNKQLKKYLKIIISTEKEKLNE